MEEILDRISTALQEGYREKTKKLTMEALAQNIPPETILNNALIPGMDIVGVRFKKCEMYLPEVLAVAGAMKSAMEVLRPRLASANIKSRGKIVIGTVKGDVHDIGKNLVGIMLEGAGYDVVDLGTDIQKEKFIEAVEREQPDILGLSALLTTTMVHMAGVIDALTERNLRDKVKVIIGGAPISRNFASEIKADGYARDAATAVDLVKGLLSPPRTQSAEAQ